MLRKMMARRRVLKRTLETMLQTRVLKRTHGVGGTTFFGRSKNHYHSSHYHYHIIIIILSICEEVGGLS